MESSRQPVLRADIERLWSAVAEQTEDGRLGVFGPESISWKVNRESALFLGAGRAALLQLAHPWVATALDQHSNLRNDPVARFHHTFRVVFTMVFGTLDQALAASRHLYQLHRTIRGRLPASVAGYAQGSKYEANEVQALIWVYATLVDSALLAYEFVMPPLNYAERNRYYAESKTMAALFGIPAEALPADWLGFEDYVRSMLTSDQLGVNAASRDMAHRVLHGKGSFVVVPQWYRALTYSWMPERLLGEFGLRYDQGEQERVDRTAEWLPRFYHRRLPNVLKFVGPYQEAMARLEGRRPGLLCRGVNRFWMGQPRMMFAEQGDRL